MSPLSSPYWSTLSSGATQQPASSTQAQSPPLDQRHQFFLSSLSQFLSPLSFSLKHLFSLSISLSFFLSVWTGKILGDRNKISLNQWKITTISNNPDYKREKIFKLKSSLCLMLDSWCCGGKWILFFVDWVNVTIFWESSLRTMDGVTAPLQ